MAKIYQFPVVAYMLPDYVDAFIDEQYRMFAEEEDEMLWEQAEEQYFINQIAKRESCFRKILNKLFA